MRQRKLANPLDRDQRQLALGQHLHIMTGDPEQRVLQVDEITLHVDRQDLPPAIPRQLVATGETHQQNAALLGFVAIPHDILPRH